MNKKQVQKSFFTAAHILPEQLWRDAYTLTEDERLRCEELRIRIGRPPEAIIDGVAKSLGDEKAQTVITMQHIDELLARATESSVHTYSAQIGQGFITTKHGHRIGICGQVFCDGEQSMMRSFSSLNLRIAKQIEGIAQPILKCYERGFRSTLIISPPGGGKSTLLRELARVLSGRYRVAVADTRYEIAACSGGQPRFEVGSCDIMSGGTRDRVIEMLMRAMSPEIIAVDELSGQLDISAIEKAANCGCQFIATAHGDGQESIAKRPLYDTLLNLGIFEKFVTIKGKGKDRQYIIEGS